MTVEAIAIIVPTKGKEDAVRDGFAEMAANVRDSEPECLKYQVYEHTAKDGSIEFAVVEEFTSEAAYKNHVESEAFKRLSGQAEKDGLFARPVDVRTIKKSSGFTSR